MQAEPSGFGPWSSWQLAGIPAQTSAPDLLRLVSREARSYALSPQTSPRPRSTFSMASSLPSPMAEVAALARCVDHSSPRQRSALQRQTW